MAKKRKTKAKAKVKVEVKAKAKVEAKAKVVETKQVKCMKCLKLFTERAWLTHNSNVHNNLSWTEGEPEIDITDEKLVMKLLKPLYKTKKMYKCEKCEKKLRSAVGFYSHIGICGKDFQDESQFKTQCSLCSKWVLPVSMKAHMTGMHSENSNLDEEIVEEKPVKEIPDVVSNKRKSALKALNLIESLSKKDETDDKIDAKTDEHKRMRFFYRTKRNCGEITEYLCKKCKFECKSKAEIVAHVEQQHPIKTLESDEEFNNETVNGGGSDMDVDEDDNIDDDDDDKNDLIDDDEDDEMDVDYDDGLSSKRGSRLYAKNTDDTHHVCLKYNTNYQDFDFAKLLPKYLHDSQKSYQENLDRCSQKLHEEYFVTKYELVTTDTDSYLKTKRSANVCFQKSKTDAKTSPDWRNLKLFESSVDNDTISVFCGGPIITADWLPVPLTAANQLLALVVQENFTGIKFTRDITNWRNKHECIQLWNFGALDDTIAIDTIKPKLEYLLVHELGEIVHMKWCPSGCYNPPERLGLLAVATTSGNLFIFCLPLIEFDRKSTESDNFVKMKPYCELDFRVTYGDLPQYATQVAWSQTCGHKLVAGGTSSGLVCIWHLPTKSKSLKKFDPVLDRYILYPIRIIYAHENYISGLSFNSFDDKLFLTCSKDFFLKFWNIESDQLISAIKGDSFMCGYMPPNSLTAVTGSEVYGMKSSTNTMLIPFRGLNYKRFYFGKYSSCTWSVSHNNWTYYTLYSTKEGLVCIDHTTPLFLPKRLRVKRARTLLTACLPHPLNDSHPDNCFSYESFIDNYGLIFYDIPLRKSQSEPKYIMEKDRLSLNCSLQSAQFVQWNPNEKSSNFFLVGYQSGIIRLRTLRIKAHNSLFV